jgi:hypothetical protein
MSCLPNPEQFEVGVERLGLAAPDDFAAGHKGPPVNESLHVEIKPYFLYPDSDGKALFLRVRGRSHEQRQQAGVPLRPPLVGDRRRPISADGEGGKGRRGRLVRGSARRNEALPVAAAVAVGADWSFIDAARDPIEKWPRFAEVALQEGQRLRFEIVPRFNSEPVHFRSGRRADAMEFFDRQRLDKGMAHLGA